MTQPIKTHCLIFRRPAMLAAAGLSLALGSAAHAAPAAREVQILVKPRNQMSEAALDALLSAHGGRERGTIPALDVRVIRVPEQAGDALLKALQRNADVEFAEPDFKAQAFGTANDPSFTSGSQWYLSKLQAPAAWDITTGSSTVIVAVLDTGVLASHPDLAGKVLPGYDFVNNDSDASDDNGHGTAVSGLIGANTNNSLGMAGLAWATPVLPVKVLGADGGGTYSGIANGITWAVDRGARIINLSLGGTSASQTLQNAVDYAWNRNVVVICAAGNNGNNVTVYPAACRNVVAVAATDSADASPAWTSFGSYVDVSAPGASILSLQGTSSYSYWDGTSFSCPITSGVAALLVSAAPQMTNAALVQALIANVDDIGPAGYDERFGFGRVNAARAVAAVATPAAPDTTAPVAKITSPANGATVSGTASVINLSATDDTGVTRVELYIGGVLFGQKSGASASFSWNTSNYNDGSYVLEARAYDAANNVGSTAITVNVKNSSVVDTIAPVVAISSPSDGQNLKGKTLKIAVEGSDNVAVKKMELFLDGVLFGTTSSSSATFSWNFSKAASGAHVLQAYAYDAAGNIGSSYKVTVYK